jgi:hypothetical protein
VVETVCFDRYDNAIAMFLEFGIKCFFLHILIY